MKGVSINGRHSYRDFGLYLQNENSCVPPPMPKTHFVKIPGRSGDLDLTEALTGRCEYNNRIISLHLGGIKDNWLSFMDEFTNLFHGKAVELVFDYDQLHFFTGRASIRGDLEKTARIGKFFMDVECDPFRYDVAEKTVTATLSGGSSTKSISITGSKIPIVPVITAAITDGRTMSVTCNGKTYVLRNGTQIVPEIAFESTASLRFTGYGTVTATARGGML